MEVGSGLTSLPRRAMLWRCVALLGVARPMWAATTSRVTTFRELARPVAIPLRQVAEPWQPLAFDAWAVDASGSDVRLKGMLVRTARAPDPADGLTSVCLTCPHEICYVNLVEEPGAAELDAAAPDHPVFVCPCHFSSFDPRAEGARLGGPTTRGLFRFRFEVRGEVVRIVQIEEEILRFLA